MPAAAPHVSHVARECERGVTLVSDVAKKCECGVTTHTRRGATRALREARGADSASEARCPTRLRRGAQLPLISGFRGKASWIIYDARCGFNTCAATFECIPRRY